ncbi:hypothetical protein B7494_g4246 [Chlorociboria aeruginascens]|nr:hypothetical protein B7494_g4246 [Chlorociboria aeruginascens]
MTTNTIEYVRLGNSGLKIAPAIVGCMSYGSSKWQKWVLDEAEALPLLKHAYDRGLNTWDTADTYSNGQSERLIAKAIKEYKIPRNRLVLLSKVFFGVAEGQANWDPRFPNEPMVNRTGLSRKHIMDAVDDSVARLGTYIDVLQIHRLDKETPMEEIMRALNDVIESGKVRYIGASSMYAWQFAMLQAVAEKNGWHKFISMQNYYNLLYREEEREMIPYCKATGVAIIPWSPIARGVLSRPWGQSSFREDTETMMKLRNDQSTVDAEIVNRVEKLAKEKGVTMAQIASAWVAHKGAYPILGLNSKERIDETVDALRVKLTDEQVAYLDEPYVPKPIFGH